MADKKRLVPIALFFLGIVLIGRLASLLSIIRDTPFTIDIGTQDYPFQFTASQQLPPLKPMETSWRMTHCDCDGSNSPYRIRIDPTTSDQIAMIHVESPPIKPTIRLAEYHKKTLILSTNQRRLTIFIVGYVRHPFALSRSTIVFGLAYPGERYVRQFDIDGVLESDDVTISSNDASCFVRLADDRKSLIAELTTPNRHSGLVTFHIDLEFHRDDRPSVRYRIDANYTIAKEAP
jgi:hypothetical protein